MSTSELQKPATFDPAAAVNAIRDKIRMSMLDVIPTEQWDALIQAEMKAFMVDRIERSSYGSETVHTSGFKKIVREILAESAKEQVKKLLDSSEWMGRWNGGSGQQEAGEAVQRYLTEKGPEIIRACLTEFVGQAIQQVVSNM